jgi:hypothetical protein
VLRDIPPGSRWSLPLALLLFSCASVEVAGGGGEGGDAGRECSDPTGAECDDGEECTTNECNVAEGLCSYPAVPDGTPCDGGALECAQGVCNKCLESDGSTKDCDDGNECTFRECEPKTGGCLELDRRDGDTCTYQGGPSICVEGDCAKPCTGDAECDDQNDCTFNECGVTERVCLSLEVPDGRDCGTSQAPGICTSGVCR